MGYPKKLKSKRDLKTLNQTYEGGITLFWTAPELRHICFENNKKLFIFSKLDVFSIELLACFCLDKVNFELEKKNLNKCKATLDDYLIKTEPILRLKYLSFTA